MQHSRREIQSRPSQFGLLPSLWSLLLVEMILCQMRRRQRQIRHWRPLQTIASLRRERVDLRSFLSPHKPPPYLIRAVPIVEERAAKVGALEAVATVQCASGRQFQVLSPVAAEVMDVNLRLSAPGPMVVPLTPQSVRSPVPKWTVAACLLGCSYSLAGCRFLSWLTFCWYCIRRRRGTAGRRS